MIIYNKLDNYFFVSADRQTFFSFEMTANLRDASPLIAALSKWASASKETFVNLFSKNINSLGGRRDGWRGMESCRRGMVWGSNQG